MECINDITKRVPPKAIEPPNPTIRSPAADWKEDLSNELSIGVSDKGYARAVLDCEDDHMAFVITMEEDFEGVVYTRGSFHARKGPCFLDATGGKEFALKFSNKDCGTKYVSSSSRICINISSIIYIKYRNYRMK